MRVRGLKLKRANAFDFVKKVAPRAGAWIETLLLVIALANICVAPRAGAWIETLYNPYKSHVIRSHPVRVRGLKLVVQR